MTQQIEVISGNALANRILNHDGNLDGFDDSLVISDDGTARDGIGSQWFTLTWGNHCVSKHLGDATISGPFLSEEEAENS
jgi:hypothetical protein